MAREQRNRLTRGILGLCIIGAASVLAVACQSSAPPPAPTSAPKPAAAAVPAAAATSAPAPAAAAPTTAAASAAIPKTGKTYNATLGDTHPVGNIIYNMSAKFAEIVKQKTNGEVVIKIVPSAQLGTGRAMIEALQTGTVELTDITNSVLGSYEPSRGIFDLPYIFRDSAHMGKVFDGPMGLEASDALEKRVGVTPVIEGVFEGPRKVYNRLRPINTLDDLKGLKIRVMESPINLASFKALGANPVPMAFSELYMGLQQGTVDGAEGAAINYLTVKFFEVAKFFSATDHLNSPLEIIASTKWLNSLPPEYKKAVLEAGLEAVKWERSQWDQSERDAEAELVKQGVKINTVDLAPFRKAVEPVWEEFGTKLNAKDKIKAILDTK